LVAVWIIQALALWAIAQLVPGITIAGTASHPAFIVAISVSLVLGLINVLVRPILLLLTLPIDVRTLGLSTLLVNAAMLRLTSVWATGLSVSGWTAAILGALGLTVVNTAFSSLASVDDDHSFFQGLVERLSRNPRLRGTRQLGRGTVMLEIDGLSYSRLKRAAERGYMPTVRAMLRDGSYAISVATAACRRKRHPVRRVFCSVIITISPPSAGTTKTKPRRWCRTTCTMRPRWTRAIRKAKVCCAAAPAS
jgi:putative membrane protein